MAPHSAQNVLNGAPSQGDRWPRALDPAYAAVDDRPLEALLDFAGRFGSLVNFYGPGNEVAGDWVEFFTQDPLVTLASIVATDIEGAERRLARLERRIRAERSFVGKRAGLVELFDAALDLPRQINRWLRGLNAARRAGASLGPHTGIDIESAIHRSLRPHLQRLKAYDLGAGLAEALDGRLGLDYREFTAAWQLDEVEPADPSIYVGSSRRERIDRALPHIRSAWQPFRDAVASWAIEAKPQWAKASAFEMGDGLVGAVERAADDALEGGGREGRRGGDHQPHVALFVAFAKLFAVTQASVNSFASRRTDLYFREILREHNRPSVADAVYLALARAKGTEPLTVSIPAGTRFKAGKNAAGRDIVYESQGGISVTSATLAKVFTIRVVSGPLTANDAGRFVPHRVLSRTVTPDQAGRAGWATFGAVDDEPAEIGFAVSSPSLKLAGGQRRIALDIRHAPHPQPSTAMLATLGAATGITPAAVFDRLVEQAFELRVSTASGWRTVGAYAVDRPAEPGAPGFTLRFTLTKDAPAVDGIPDSGLAPAIPAVRADLRQQRVTLAGPVGEVSVYPLSVLMGLTVTSVTVHVEVAGLPGVRVANTDGDVDQTKPFPAFGAVPTVGSHLRIRHAELFSKRVSRLALRITWYDLPKNQTGLRGYYRRYVIDASGAGRGTLFDNQTFRASVSVDRPGWWTIATRTNQDDHCLFRTDDRPDAQPDADAALATSTSIDDLAIQPVEDPPAGYNPSDGCIRVQLTEPAYAFGHAIYQQNMMNAVMVEVPNDAKCEAACRENYAVLLEATRRLETLLKDDTSTGSLGGALHWLSPLGWLSRLANGLRTAYLALTRSVLAYVAQRPGAPERSGWIIRIKTAPGGSHDATGPRGRRHAYQRTVKSTLSLTLGTLLDVADTCLEECLTEWRDLVPTREWQRLRQQLTDARRARLSDRLATLRSLLGQLGEAGADAGADPAPQLLGKCHAFLLAASWVHDCEAGCVGDRESTYKKAVRANLAKCVGVIQTLHDTVVKACKDDCLGPRKRPLPNPPYLPQVEALSVGYSASAPATFCHLLPYGGYRQASVSEAEPPTLLPQFAHAGNLYLGFSGLVVPQTLHLYARMGRNERDRSTVPPVEWEYLAANRWLRLHTPPPRADGAHGLQGSGTISLALPDAGAGDSTVLPAEYRWLRAAVGDHPDDFPRTIGIDLHSVKAVRQLSGTEDDDLGRPLPAHSVAGFVRPIKGIAAVTQPAGSFGGQPPETDVAFQTRVTERLRHKDRAILGWDYERLVLEQFPSVWKVRTLPARRQRDGEREPAGPGRVRVVIVPGPHDPDVADPLVPAASGETLARIEETLRGAAGRFVEVHVVNPVYVRIRVTATVEWRDAADPRVCAERLKDSLIEYLSPWPTGVRDDGYYSEPQISRFVQSCDDVEALVSIRFDYDPSDAVVSDPDRCFLTSAAAHTIRHVTETVVEAGDGY